MDRKRLNFDGRMKFWFSAIRLMVNFRKNALNLNAKFYFNERLDPVLSDQMVEADKSDPPF